MFASPIYSHPVTAREKAMELLDRLRIEAAIKEGARESDASSDDLDSALARIGAWLSDGNPEHLSGLGRMVTDRWALTSELGAALIELEHQVCEAG